MELNGHLNVEGIEKMNEEKLDNDRETISRDFMNNLLDNLQQSKAEAKSDGENQLMYLILKAIQDNVEFFD